MTPTPEIPIGPNVPPTTEAVKSMTAANLEALKQTIAPTAVIALTIAGIAALTLLGLKAIITGKNPLKGKSKTILA